MTLCREEVMNQLRWMMWRRGLKQIKTIPEAESSEDEEEKVVDITQPTIKRSKHLRHLRQLLTEEISSKQTQKNINYFFKAMNAINSNQNFLVLKIDA
ncbi:hypothetical protein PR048_012305, partial [Dryococelus australis]